MRIVGQRDYYDGALAYGADPTLVYARRTRETDGIPAGLPEALDVTRAPRRDRSTGAGAGGRAAESFDPCALLFCGKAYPFYLHDHYHRPVDGRRSTTLWTAASVEAAVEAGTSGTVLRRWHGIVLDGWGRRPFNGRNVRAWFGCAVDGARAAEIHEALGSPCILFRTVADERGAVTVVDPVLGDIGFQRVRDPYAAFQEIAMYLGGVMRSAERTVAGIPDDVRAAKHGMDATSFRRPPRTGAVDRR